MNFKEAFEKMLNGDHLSGEERTYRVAGKVYPLELQVWDDRRKQWEEVKNISDNLYLFASDSWEYAEDIEY